MPRPRKEDRTAVRDMTLTLRLSSEDRAMLDRLVAREAAELSDRGIEVTAASYVRGLIRRQGRLDLAAVAPPAPIASRAEPSAALPAVAPPAVSAEKVKARLAHAIASGRSQASIATQATPPIDKGQLSRFCTTGGGLSAEKLAGLDATLRAMSF